MRAVLGDTTLAEADEKDLVRIEGNWYFPPQSLRSELFQDSPTPYTCPWKGAAQYYSVVVDGVETKDAAWAYPDLYPGAVERVGTDFSGYVAFSPGVRVE